MQQRWIGKNVDLDLLSQSVEDFFKGKGFLTKRTDCKGEHTILWMSQRRRGNPKEAMRVKVLGDSNDFVVEILASELTISSIRLGLLTKPIGGGYIALKNIRLKEALEKLEKEFWAYVEEKIASLSRLTEEHA